VALIRTDVSEDRIASIFRVNECEQVQSEAVSSCIGGDSRNTDIYHRRNEFSNEIVQASHNSYFDSGNIKCFSSICKCMGPILNSVLAGDEWSTPRSSREEMTLCPLDMNLQKPGDVPEVTAKGFKERVQLLGQLSDC
jgi:hypothetical protein